MSWLDRLFGTRRYADGLSSALPMEPQASPPKASITREEETIVHLRSMRTPGARWDDRVHYDVWGTPFIKGYGNGPYPFGDDTSLAVTLRSDGTTDAWVYGTEWRHKSGPPVRFTKKPSRPFAEVGQ